MEFLKPDHPLLRAKSRPLSEKEISDPKMQQLFDEMLAFAKGEQTDQQKHILVGLAAPQIGKDVRIILVDVKADGKGSVSDLRLYINPEIIECSEEKEEWYEGCFSTGNVKGIVSRSKQITVKALDRTGHSIQETHSGYVARIFQHEIDHLNGIRFPDRISDVKELLLVKPEQMHGYRNKEEWRKWPCEIPQIDWKQYCQ